MMGGDDRLGADLARVSPEQGVARRAGAFLNAGRRLVAAPDENTMGDAEARAQRPDRGRFIGALFA